MRVVMSMSVLLTRVSVGLLLLGSLFLAACEDPAPQVQEPLLFSSDLYVRLNAEYDAVTMAWGAEIVSAEQFTNEQFSLIVKYALVNNACPGDVTCAAGVTPVVSPNIPRSCECPTTPTGISLDENKRALTLALPEIDTDPTPTEFTLKYQASENITAANSPMRAAAIADLPKQVTASGEEAVLADFSTSVNITALTQGVDVEFSGRRFEVPMGDGLDNYSPLYVELGDQLVFDCASDVLGFALFVHSNIYNSDTCNAGLGDTARAIPPENYFPNADTQFCLLPGPQIVLTLTENSQSLNNTVNFVADSNLYLAHLSSYSGPRPPAAMTPVKPNPIREERVYTGLELKNSYCGRHGVKLQVYIAGNNAAQ